MRVAAVLLLAMLCVASVAVGQEETFDVAVFKAPPGWERVSGPGPLSLRAKGGTAQIFLFPSRPSGGSPQENFQTDWAKLVTAALGKLDAPKLSSEQRPDGWTAVSGAATKGQGFAVILFTATGFDRAFSIVASVAAQEHLAAIRDFFTGLKLRGNAGSETQPKPVAAPAASGSRSPLAGLYFHLQAGISSGARLEVRTRYFLPGNRITRTFPFGSGDVFDVSRCSPDMCGSYTIAAEQLNIRWDNGQIDRLSLRSTADGIHIDGTLFRTARPVSEPVLAGVWTGAGQTGGSFSNVYRFERDGRFTFGTGQGGLGGRYRVQGLTLILNFDDGAERRRTLFATSPTDPAGMICVDGEVFARRQ
jgi:hypothetical protein